MQEVIGSIPIFSTQAIEMPTECCRFSSVVERILGKDEVSSSTLESGSFFLLYGVKVAREILVLSVWVRILVQQLQGFLSDKTT